MRRAAEQPAARQTRLATDRQRTHERTAAEQPEARQARLERLRDYSICSGLTLWSRKMRLCTHCSPMTLQLRRQIDIRCGYRYVLITFLNTIS